MVSNTFCNGSAPTANRGNPLYGRQMSFLASVMEILQMKGQKGKKSNKTTLQTGMTEKEFSEGGEKLPSIALQGCPALIFILFSSVFPSLLQMINIGGNITPQVTFWLTQTGIQKLHLPVTFSISFSKTHCSFILVKKITEDQDNNVQSSNSTVRKRE